MEMSVFKRGGRWHFTKTINGARYRGALKTARTKVQAEEAERAILLMVHQGTYALVQDKQTLAEFVEDTYLPWAKANKRSWQIDTSRLKPIREFFGKKKMGDISPFLIESFKIRRMKAEIVYKKSSKPRTPASVNRELCLLSKILALAVRDRKIADIRAVTSICCRVRSLAHVTFHQTRRTDSYRNWSVYGRTFCQL
jgi:hypothetical protein